MIKNIIFDIGNVLADFCWKEMMMAKGCDEPMAERIADASVRTEQWYELDRGGHMRSFWMLLYEMIRRLKGRSEQCLQICVAW